MCILLATLSVSISVSLEYIPPIYACIFTKCLMFLRWCFCFVAFRQVNWQNFALYIGDRKIQLNQANDLEKLSAVGGQESLWRRRGVSAAGWKWQMWNPQTAQTRLEKCSPETTFQLCDKWYRFHLRLNNNKLWALIAVVTRSRGCTEKKTRMLVVEWPLKKCRKY